MNQDEQLRCLFENAPDLIYRMSLPEGQYEYVSPAVKKIFGFTPQELYNSPILIQQILHPEWIDYFEKEWGKLLNGDMPDSYEYKIVDKEGKIKWIHQRNVLVRDESGTPVAIEGIVRDVTQQKETEDELKKSEEKVRQLLTHTYEAIYGLDMNGNCTFANPSCVKMLGYKSEEELIGKNIHELIHSRHADGREYPEEECHIYEAFIKNTTTRIDNEVFWKADGSSFPVEYFSHPIHSEHGEVTGCVVTFMDISARKNDELIKLALIEKLEKALSEVKTLRGIIPICSHCKHIRDDVGAWNQVEKYVSDHTDAEFSHGICPECLKKHYPEDYEAIMNEMKSDS